MARGSNRRAMAVVTAFDPVVGLGQAMLDDSRIVGFHATAMADGTRRIGVGALVDLSVVAGANGRWEATDLVLREKSFPCPVCRSAVAGDVDCYEICPHCGWEDDPVQSTDPSYAGGANGSSLDEARAHWLLRGE